MGPKGHSLYKLVIFKPYLSKGTKEVIELNNSLAFNAAGNEYEAVFVRLNSALKEM